MPLDIRVTYKVSMSSSAWQRKKIIIGKFRDTQAMMTLAPVKPRPGLSLNFTTRSIL